MSSVLEQNIAKLISASEDLTSTVEQKVDEIDAHVANASDTLDTWKTQFVERINNVDVYKQGRIKRFYIDGPINNGGYVKSGGPDSGFPHCPNPQPKTYINLLEFKANSSNHFGDGDMFRIEFIMTHRGMYAEHGYTDHLVFTGTSWSDCVSGEIDIKRISANNHMQLALSAPKGDKEIALDTNLIGTSKKIFFRKIRDLGGIARLTLKVDPRFHCGASRQFSADVTYTSDLGSPSPKIVTTTKPTWDTEL